LEGQGRGIPTMAGLVQKFDGDEQKGRCDRHGGAVAVIGRTLAASGSVCQTAGKCGESSLNA